MILYLVIDNNVNPWRGIDGGWFDAIITDPPYGVREKSEKVGTSKKFDDWIDFDGTHFPDKVAYNLNDVFADLMKFSNKHLRVGGKLVFWYPVSREELKSKSLKACFQLQTINLRAWEASLPAAFLFRTVLRLRANSEHEDVEDIASLFKNTITSFRRC